MREMTRRTLDFASIVLAVLVLVPSGAHLLPVALFLVGVQIAERWREIGAALASLLSALAQCMLNLSEKPSDLARVCASLPLRAPARPPLRARATARLRSSS